MQKLDYHRVETCHIETEYFVRAILWNLKCACLLLGGSLLQLWASKATNEGQENIYLKNIALSGTFQLGAVNDGDSDDNGRETVDDMTSDITGVTGFGIPLGNALGHRIETLLKDWHHIPDLLYAVHPLDRCYFAW